jgi:hypothetical protein
MTGAVTVVLSPGRRQNHVAALEWDFLRTWRHNVMLEGPQESTDCLVRLLLPYLPRPVLWNPLHTPLPLPAGECGALVLQDVAALGRAEQNTLLKWLDDSNQRRQVISTTRRSLFPLVGRGLFDAVLYYRLNVMLLSVRPHLRAGAMAR